MKLSLYIISALFLWQVISACSISSTKQSDKLTIAGLQKSIADIVSDKNCDSKEQCQSIAYGAKACGGPTSYLTYSLKHTDVVKLSGEVRLYNQLVKEENIRSGRVSNCSMLIPPTLVCRESKCVISR